MIFCVVLEVGSQQGLGDTVGMDKCAPKSLSREKHGSQSSQHWKGPHELGNLWKRGESTRRLHPSPVSTETWVITTACSSPPTMGPPCPHRDQLGEGLEDEDEGDEEGEDLLCVAGQVAHQEAALTGHHHQHQQDQPEADPDPSHDVFHAIAAAELGSHRAQPCQTPGAPGLGCAGPRVALCHLPGMGVVVSWCGRTPSVGPPAQQHLPGITRGVSPHGVSCLASPRGCHAPHITPGPPPGWLYLTLGHHTGGITSVRPPCATPPVPSPAGDTPAPPWGQLVAAGGHPGAQGAPTE